MAKEAERNFATLDLYLTAYLSLKGLQPTLELKNGRVIFIFPSTENLYRLTMDYNTNVSVPVADYVTVIKALRGQMLSMRGGRK